MRRPPIQKPLRLFALSTAVLFGSAGRVAHGVEEATATYVLWRCWYDQQIHVTCLVDISPLSDVPWPNSPLPAFRRK